MSGHRKLAEAFLSRVWAEEDATAIYEMFSGAVQVSGLEEMDQVGPREFHAFHRMMTAQFSAISHTIRRSVEEGEWLALICDVTAVHRDTGVTVATTTHIMLRVHKGQIVEAHNQLNLIQILEEIGRLPPRTLDQCLLGAQLEVRRPKGT